MRTLNQLKEDLAENIGLLNECINENDAKGIATQRRVIRMIERELAEASLPHEITSEVYGYDYY